MPGCTAWKMQKSAGILLLILHLLEASLVSKPNSMDTCVGNDVKVYWKYDKPAQILAVFYKVKLPGGSLVTILTYDGNVANVLNNYNVQWNNESGSITIVNSTLSNTGDYNIELTYAGGLPADSHSVSVLVLDPPKTLSYIQNGMEFTCKLDSFGTPNVSIYIKLDGVKHTTPNVLAGPGQDVECCINGAAVKCMVGIVTTDSTYCITAQSQKNYTCLPYCWVVVALFVVLGLQITIIGFMSISARCTEYRASTLFLQSVNVANYVTVVWSAIMVGLLNHGCTEKKDWCSGLANASLYTSMAIAVMKIVLMIYSMFPEPEPDLKTLLQMHQFGARLKKLHGFGGKKLLQNHQNRI